MAPSRRFANYPGAQEAPAESLDYKLEMGRNPVLRGWPMVVAASIVSSSAFIQRYLWENAGFGSPKDIPGLEKEVPVFHPTVIPLADDSASPQEAPGVEPELFPAQPHDLPGRYYSAADYHALYAAGEATPLQVAQAVLGLARRPSKYADAWRWHDEAAVLAAARASTERWAAGRPRGLLDGVPFGVKDDVDVAGFVSSVGLAVDETLPFFRTAAAETLAPVRALEAAGAVLVGKLTMHETGMDTTGCNPAVGTPTNWFNKAYYPGGSSSGPASALGAGVIPIAVGTDAGGSVRIPTAFNGVYGLKTSHGRTATLNSTMCIVGPMAGTVADLTVAYRVMARPDPTDPTGSLFAPSIPPSPQSKKYLGICAPWLAAATEPVQAILGALVTHLTTTRGYEAVPMALPHLGAGQVAHAATCLSEAAAAARGRVVGTTRPWLAPLGAPNRVLLATGARTPAVDYLAYARLRARLMRHLAALFARHPGLVLVSPTTPVAGWPRAGADQRFGFMDGNMSMYNMTFCWVANSSGCPAVTAPAGYVEPEKGEGRLPVGVMGMAEWGGEETCLAFASEVEAYLAGVYPGGRRRPEEWADVLALAREGEGSGGK